MFLSPKLFGLRTCDHFSFKAQKSIRNFGCGSGSTYACVTVFFPVDGERDSREREMADNLFEGLPPPSSSQQHELPISSQPDESKNQNSSPAPTLVLKSSLKRSKPADSAPNVSGKLNSRKKLSVTDLCYLNSIRYETLLLVDVIVTCFPKLLSCFIHWTHFFLFEIEEKSVLIEIFCSTIKIRAVNLVLFPPSFSYWSEFVLKWRSSSCSQERTKAVKTSRIYAGARTRAGRYTHKLTYWLRAKHLELIIVFPIW